MASLTLNSQIDAPGARRHRIKPLRLMAAAMILILAIAGWVAWQSLIPGRTPRLPATLTQRDAKEIAQLCRLHTVRSAMNRLRQAEFGWFLRSTRVLFQQRIDRFIDDRDGTYRVYVVTDDPKAPDGFNPWFRHQITRTNGQWTILRSY